MLWVCSACTAKYSVGAPRCPQCGSTDFMEDGMPKIHAEGRVTEEPTPPVDELLDEQPAADEPAAVTEPADAAPKPSARAKRKNS